MPPVLRKLLIIWTDIFHDDDNNDKKERENKNKLQWKKRMVRKVKEEKNN